ncbi:MAG: ATP-binding protein [Reyranella sp.]
MLRDASLGRRLLVGAAVFITGALVLAAVVIGFVLHRFVQGQIDQRLDTEVVFLASMLRADGNGTLSLAGSADGPPFDRPARGWYWQVSGPHNVVRSRSLGGATLDLPDLPPPPRPPPPNRDGPPPPGERPRPADGPGPDGVPLHFRIQHVSVAGLPATIAASAPRDAVIGPLREAMTTLGLSLAALGLALVLAIVLQVRLGLRPLDRLRSALADVRAGRSERVPAEQPAEIRPLVAELNALLEQNAANLERARRHVANLAHGLKTPLATLAIALSARGADSGELRDLVDVMERRIRHHLGRARAAALDGPVRARTLVAPHLEALGDVLGKVHAGRGVALAIDVPPDLAVACERQDFDEIAGNLLENAFKWTRGAVEVCARADQARTVTLTIDDDGPGLRPEQIPQVMQPGQRLDESAPGFGFGLSITRELVELYGGTLDLDRAPKGGLRVSLRLPMADKP